MSERDDKTRKLIEDQLNLVATKLYCDHNKNEPCAECLEKIHGVISEIYGNISGIYGFIYKMHFENFCDTRGDVSGIYGNASGIFGDVSGLRGDVSGIVGDATGAFGDISNAKGDISGVRGNISKICGDFSGIDADTHEIIKMIEHRNYRTAKWKERYPTGINKKSR